ncbi:hypothetical protein HK100_005025 [Physocladia obscura]|uniref:Uncharacterized protein n=1 Tax=Physocladia obscura TaxID=109957 RepID=A0AAD5ST45_9FUNG|nr:hypothetical protein HK100_005025 [Physocladia obscura]
MTKLGDIETQLGNVSRSLVPDFSGMMELEGLGADLAAALPTLDSELGFRAAAGTALVMHEFGPTELIERLEKAGIAGPLRALPGIGRLILQIDTSGDYVHRVTVSAISLLPHPSQSPNASPSGSATANANKTEAKTNVDSDKAVEDFLVVVLGPHASGSLVAVGADNFLIDLFLRRRFLSFENLKCFQDISSNLPEDPSPLEQVSRSISHLASSIASTLTHPVTHPTTPTILTVANPSTTEDETLHPAIPSRSNNNNNNSSSNNHTKQFQLTSNSETFYQHEFSIDDGKTAKLLNTFMRSSLPEKISATVVEWLALQNPKAEFGSDRKKVQLPGQHHPGLGLGRQVTDMLVDMCQETHRDCLVSSPEYFHNAVMYNLGGWKFLNPAFQGYLEALQDDLKADLEEKGMAAVSWAFTNGHVKSKDGIIEIWQLHEQFLPVSARMIAYSTGHEYTRLVSKFSKLYRGKVHIDWENAKEIERYVVVASTKKSIDGGGNTVV